MNARILWLSIGAAFAVLLVWKRKEVAEVGEQVVSTVRGLRNRNPGNIEKGASWQGLAPVQTDSRFAVFSEMKYGVRAALKVFRNYQQLYNLRTIAQMVSRWAPPSENDTAAYIAAVSKRVGVASNAPLNLADPQIAHDFLRAIFRHENGIAAEAIPSDTINAGIRLA